MHVQEKEEEHLNIVISIFKLLNITFRGGKEALPAEMTLLVPLKKRYLKLK